MKRVFLVPILLLSTLTGLTAEEMEVMKVPKMGVPQTGPIPGLTAEEVGEVKVLNTGDPQAGLAYAKEVCANCHSVSTGKSPEPEATAFREIADVPGMSAKALLVWMHTQHPTV